MYMCKRDQIGSALKIDSRRLQAAKEHQLIVHVYFLQLDCARNLFLDTSQLIILSCFIIYFWPEQRNTIAKQVRRHLFLETSKISFILNYSFPKCKIRESNQNISGKSVL